MDLEEEFGFYRCVEGEGVGADGGADVAAGVAHQLLEEFAGAVGYFGVVFEVWVGLDEDADADDAREAGPVAVEFCGGDGEGVDGALGGGFLGEVDGDGSAGIAVAILRARLRRF